MARIKDKETSRLLRRAGESIADIARKINASKSTVSYWCRDIKLSNKQIAALQLKSKHAGRAKCIELGEKKRDARLKNIQKQKELGAKTIQKLSKRDLYLLGLGLYWGEGYKTSNDEFGFTNSDPKVVQLYMKWLTEIFQIKKEDIVLRVGINQIHTSREKEVLNFWSKLTDIPTSQFTKTSFVKAKSKKEFKNYLNHNGTLRIKVRRGMNIKYRILGALEAL